MRIFSRTRNKKSKKKISGRAESSIVKKKKKKKKKKRYGLNTRRGRYQAYVGEAYDLRDQGKWGKPNETEADYNRRAQSVRAHTEARHPILQQAKNERIKRIVEKIDKRGNLYRVWLKGRKKGKRVSKRGWENCLKGLVREKKLEAYQVVFEVSRKAALRLLTENPDQFRADLDRQVEGSP